MPCWRILQAITPSCIGGAETHVLALIDGLQRHGHQVTLFCPGDRHLAQEARRRGLDLWAPSTCGKVDPFTLVRLRGLIRRRRFDVVHTHLSTASLLGSLAAHAAGVPAVATVHGFNSPTCFRYADHLVAVSDSVRRHFVRLGVDPARIDVVRNGIDLQRFSRPADREFRRQHGLSEEAFLVGMVGRLALEKGHRFLLEAVALLTRDPRLLSPELAARLHVVIVGEGSERRALEGLARRLGIADRTLFTGFLAEVDSALASFDMFVLPSLNEGLSIAALEAMALGRPVVASRVGGIPEVVAEGETGLLVEPGQIAPLATAIATLAADPARRESMGAAGRRRARECFDGERMTAEIEAIYAAQTERWRRRQGR